MGSTCGAREMIAHPRSVFCFDGQGIITFERYEMQGKSEVLGEGMQHYTFMPRGVCSRLIDFDLDDEGKIHNLSYFGGCNGNLKAIGKLLEGADAKETIGILQGNTCGRRPTSCADQLTKGLEAALDGSLAPSTQE